MTHRTFSKGKAKAPTTTTSASSRAVPAVAPLDISLMPDDALLREAQIVSKPGRPGILPVSSASWWRWVSSGKAPAPVRLGERITAWRAGDIRAFVAARAAA